MNTASRADARTYATCQILAACQDRDRTKLDLFPFPLKIVDSTTRKVNATNCPPTYPSSAAGRARSSQPAAAGGLSYIQRKGPNGAPQNTVSPKTGKPHKPRQAWPGSSGGSLSYPLRAIKKTLVFRHRPGVLSTCAATISKGKKQNLCRATPRRDPSGSCQLSPQRDTARHPTKGAKHDPIHANGAAAFPAAVPKWR